MRQKTTLSAASQAMLSVAARGRCSMVERQFLKTTC
jgi:hypothetical protein